jgi:hypothetical protein
MAAVRLTSRALPKRITARQQSQTQTRTRQQRQWKQQQVAEWQHKRWKMRMCTRWVVVSLSEQTAMVHSLCAFVMVHWPYVSWRCMYRGQQHAHGEVGFCTCVLSHAMYVQCSLSNWWCCSMVWGVFTWNAPSWPILTLHCACHTCHAGV